MDEFKNTIAKLSTHDMEISKFIERINYGKEYKMDLKIKEKQLKKIKK